MNFSFFSTGGNYIVANQVIPQEIIQPASYELAISAEFKQKRVDVGISTNAHWYDKNGRWMRPATVDEWVFAHSWGQIPAFSNIVLPTAEYREHQSDPNVCFRGKWFHAFAVDGIGIRYQDGKTDKPYYNGTFGTAFILEE